jgi:SAM-dependent methyltransferase
MATTSNPTTAGSATDGIDSAYSRDFFDHIGAGSLRSARVVLRLLFELHPAKSVIDVGCGDGSWLLAAEELGATQLAGVDGKWVDPSILVTSTIEFQPVDLESDFQIENRYDLCVSMEVAEHLSATAARRFVGRLCAASDVVLFSAAIPGQGGVQHLNEQPQSYWSALFHEADYLCYDFLRAALWTDSRVETWYRQNALVYVKQSHPLSIAAQQRQAALKPPLDVVHPEMFLGNLDDYRRAVDAPTLRFCSQLFLRWIRRKVVPSQRS